MGKTIMHKTTSWYYWFHFIFSYININNCEHVCVHWVAIPWGSFVYGLRDLHEDVDSRMQPRMICRRRPALAAKQLSKGFKCFWHPGKLFLATFGYLLLMWNSIDLFIEDMFNLYTHTHTHTHTYIYIYIKNSKLII
jgi:hypothetical protein